MKGKVVEEPEGYAHFTDYYINLYLPLTKDIKDFDSCKPLGTVKSKKLSDMSLAPVKSLLDYME